MYAEQNQAGESSDGAPEGDAVDAEFEEVKRTKSKSSNALIQ